MHSSAVICQSIATGLSIPNGQDPRYALQDARRSDATGHLRTAVSRRREDGRGSNGSGQGFTTGRLKASPGPEAGRAGARPPRRSPDALYRAARCLGPADRLDQPDGRLLAKPVRPPRRSAQTNGPMTAPEKSTMKIKLTSVYVDKQDKALRFYT